MATSQITPQQIAQWKLFNPQQNPLYPSSPTGDPSQATPPPTSAPPASNAQPEASSASTPPPAEAPQSGQISSAMKPPTEATPNAPIANAPTPFHHGTLAKIMLGIGEAVGNPLATHIGQRDRERQQEVDEYTRNLPAAQNRANLAQQEATANISHTQAQTHLENVQAEVAQQNLPLQEAVAKHYQTLQQTWQNKGTPDFDRYAQSYLAGLPPAMARMLAPHLQDIKNTPQTGKGYTIAMQDDVPKSIEMYGQSFQPDKTGKFGPEVPAQAVQEFQAAQAAHGVRRGEKRQDEAYVAGQAASRQAQAFSNQMTMETTKKVQPHIDEALGADERLSRMEGSYAKAKKGDQQAMLALLSDHLGMTMGLQKGARITKDVLQEAQQSQPWLARLGAKFDDRGFLSGVALGPEQMKQMLDLGYEARDRSYSAAHDAATTYGQPLPEGFLKTEQKRPAGSKPALQEQGAQGAKQPPHATQTGVGSLDKKKHWLDAQGNDLGLAE